MSKKSMLIIVLSVVTVLALGAGGVFLFSQFDQPEKTVEQFETAIKEENPDLLKELIIPDDEEAAVDEESAKALLDYLKANNHSYQVIKEGLHKQLEKKDYSKTNQQISLVLGEKKGLGKDYKLLVKTASIQISGQHEDDAVHFNIDKSKVDFEENEDGLYGPFLPGTYSIVLTVKNGLGDFTETKKLDVWGNDIITYLVDTKSLVKQDEKIKNDIVAAVDTFNYDMSVFDTTEFNLEAFTNLDATAEEMQYSQDLVNSVYLEAVDYIDEFHSKYEGAVLNLDDFSISYFDGKWSAEVTSYVSYERKMKLVDYPGYEDISYEIIREFQLNYDNDEKKWMIYDFIEDEYGVDKHKGWKETLKLEGSKDALKWTRSENSNPASNI
ncbi:MAG: TcaA second domain-containing protein [Lysinibacillus sp.]